MGGGGVTYHMYSHGMCHFGMLFLGQKMDFRVSLLVKSQIDIINFGVSV